MWKSNLQQESQRSEVKALRSELSLDISKAQYEGGGEGVVSGRALLPLNTFRFFGVALIYVRLC